MDMIIFIAFISLLLLSAVKPFIGICTFFIISYIRPQDHMLIMANAEPAKWILIITTASFLFSRLRSIYPLTKAKQNIGIMGILLFIMISRVAVIDPMRWTSAFQDFIRICRRI